MPRRAVDLRLETGVHVVFRSAPPLLTARHQLQLDDALRAKIDLHGTIQVLAPEGNHDSEALVKRGLDLGLEDDLRKAGRPDLLFALAHEDDIHRRLLAGALERVQRGEECHLRALLVRCAAPDDDLAESWLVDEPRLERRRRPFARIELLDVVHEVDASRGWRAGLEGRERAR